MKKYFDDKNVEFLFSKLREKLKEIYDSTDDIQVMYQKVDDLLERISLRSVFLMKWGVIDMRLSDRDYELLDLIAERAKGLLKDIDPEQVVLDLEAVMLNSDCLDLEKLYNFDNFSFVHDIIGIRNHLDRETGEIDVRFLPRCSK